MGSMTDTTEDIGPSMSAKTIAGGAIGNAMEWYDFAIYGFLAPVMAPLFFPSDDKTTSLLAIYGAFAAGYLARPIGAIVFGHIGDKHSRRLVLIVTVGLMGVSSLSIGLLPTADTIGVYAGVLLILLRVLQGFSVGGEYTGSTVYIAESSPIHRRGFLTSFIVAASTFGVLLGSGFTTALTNLFSAEAMANGLWRVPFLFGFGILLLSIVLRVSMTDTEQVGEPQAGSPVIASFRHHWRDLIRVCCLVFAIGVSFYVLFVYAVSYLTDVMNVGAAEAMDINTLALLVLMLLMPAAGLLSDYLGRKPVAIFGALGLILAAYPAFTMMHSGNAALILVGQVGITFFYAFYAGVLPAMIAEVAHPAVRMSVTAIGYNLVMALFGGTAPLVATYLVNRTGDDFMPAYYIMFAATVSFVAIMLTRETNRSEMQVVQPAAATPAAR